MCVCLFPTPCGRAPRSGQQPASGDHAEHCGVRGPGLAGQVPQQSQQGTPREPQRIAPLCFPPPHGRVSPLPVVQSWGISARCMRRWRRHVVRVGGRRSTVDGRPSGPPTPPHIPPSLPLRSTSARPSLATASAAPIHPTPSAHEPELITGQSATAAQHVPRRGCRSESVPRLSMTQAPAHFVSTFSVANMGDVTKHFFNPINPKPETLVWAARAYVQASYQRAQKEEVMFIYSLQFFRTLWRVPSGVGYLVWPSQRTRGGHPDSPGPGEEQSPMMPCPSCTRFHPALKRRIDAETFTQNSKLERLGFDKRDCEDGTGQERAEHAKPAAGT